MNRYAAIVCIVVAGIAILANLGSSAVEGQAPLTSASRGGSDEGSPQTAPVSMPAATGAAPETDENAPASAVTFHARRELYSVSGRMTEDGTVCVKAEVWRVGTDFDSARISFGDLSNPSFPTHYFTVPIDTPDDLVRFAKSIDELESSPSAGGHVSLSLAPAPTPGLMYAGYAIKLKKNIVKSAHTSDQLDQGLRDAFREGKSPADAAAGAIVKAIKRSEVYFWLEQGNPYEGPFGGRIHRVRQWRPIDVAVLREVLAGAAVAAGRQPPATPEGLEVSAELYVTRIRQIAGKPVRPQPKLPPPPMAAETARSPRIAARSLPPEVPKFAQGIKAYRVSWLAFRPHAYRFVNHDVPARPILGDMESPWQYPVRLTFTDGSVELKTWGKLTVPFGTLMADGGSGYGEVVRDIVIDRQTLYQLGDRGELRIVGLWKPEYLKGLVLDEQSDPIEYDLFVKEQTDYRKSRENDYITPGARPSWFETFGHQDYEPEYDPQKLIEAIDDPVNYPWRSVGLMRLGDRFYAWRHSVNTKLVSLDPGSGKHFRVDRLFGLSPARDFPAGSDGPMRWPFHSVADGLLDTKSTVLARIALDGVRTPLSTTAPDVFRHMFSDGATTVVGAQDGGEYAIVSFDGSGQAISTSDRYPVEAVQCGRSGLHAGNYPYWVFKWTANDRFHEHVYTLDTDTGRLVKRSAFATTRDQFGDSAYNVHSPDDSRPWEEAIHHIDFTSDGKRYFYMGYDNDVFGPFSVFDMATGKIQKLNVRHFRTKLDEAAKEGVSLESIQTEPCFVHPEFYSEGAPEFSVFDTHYWTWRKAKVGKTADWASFTGLPEPAWKPLRATPYGHWFASKSRDDDGQAGYALIFVEIGGSNDAGE